MNDQLKSQSAYAGDLRKQVSSLRVVNNKLASLVEQVNGNNELLTHEVKLINHDLKATRRAVTGLRRKESNLSDQLRDVIGNLPKEDQMQNVIILHNLITMDSDQIYLACVSSIKSRQFQIGT